MNIRTALQHPFANAPSLGEAVEVAPGILWLRMPLLMVMKHVNVYALRDGDGWTVIDTGSNNPEASAAWDAALAGPLGGLPVTRLILTHHHPDHVGLAGRFIERGAELWMTRGAWLTARMLLLDHQDLPPAETVTFWRRAGMPEEMVAQRATQRPFNMTDASLPLPLGFHRIAEGDVLQLGGRTWTVHCGDGHAVEQATFWSDDGLVITADQVLPSITPIVGVYATEPDADPLGEWLESCQRFATLARPDHLVLPGHQLPFVGLPARLADLQTHHHLALDKLLEALEKGPRTASDCFPLLFRREIGPATFTMAMAESVAHLNYLWHLRQIRRELHSDGTWLWHG